MEDTSEFGAIKTYYEVSNAEYDRIHTLYDQIDGKVGLFLTIMVGIPTIILGLALRDVEAIELSVGVLWGLGIVAFLVALWHVLQAIRIRDVKLGIPYEQFKSHCKKYDEEAMQEWVADILIESSEFNYHQALKKADHLERMLYPLLTEIMFLLVGTIVAFIG